MLSKHVDQFTVIIGGKPGQLPHPKISLPPDIPEPLQLYFLHDCKFMFQISHTDMELLQIFEQFLFRIKIQLKRVHNFFNDIDI